MLLVLVPERNMNDGSQRPSGFKSCASLETWSMNRIEKEYWPNKKVTKPASKAKVCQKRAERCFPCGSTKISRWMAEGWVIFLGGWGMVVSDLLLVALAALAAVALSACFTMFHYVSLCFTAWAPQVISGKIAIDGQLCPTIDMNQVGIDPCQHVGLGSETFDIRHPTIHVNTH